MVKKWNPRKIAQKTTILVVGKRNRGKSTLMVDVCRFIKAPKAIVLSATDKCSHFYEKYFPSHFIYENYDESLLENIVAAQKKAVKSNELMEKSGLLLIIDDTGFDRKFLKSKILAEILMNGRWYNITVIIGVQDPASLPLHLRGQIDYVLCLAESFKVNQERLYNWFFGIYPSFKDFRNAFVEITKDYGAIVLDNVTTNINSIKNTVFWYKADPKLKFKYGSREYRHSKRNV